MYDKRLIKMISLSKKTAKKQGVPVAWKGVEDFSKWAYENGYDETKYLKRIDVGAGFTPDNCYFSQDKNGNQKIMLEYKGEKKPLMDWCEELGLNPDVVRGRITHGWDVEKAFTQPTQNREKVEVDIFSGYEGLANAIVVRAVVDYRIALKMQSGKVKIKDPFIRIEELEAFFQSGYFEILTDLDGKTLMRMVKKEVLKK